MISAFRHESCRKAETWKQQTCSAPNDAAISMLHDLGFSA